MVVHSSNLGPILLLGSSSQDIVGRLDADLQPGTSNPARIRVSYGGVARNVAENLARLGQPVKLISVVGKDRPGDELLEYRRGRGGCVRCPAHRPLPHRFLHGRARPARPPALRRG
jgi:sugar/nucleoside kinase (ribokinase family)